MSNIKFLIEEENSVVNNVVSNFELEKDKPYLSEFLKTIKGKAREYKRVTISPLRYAGGKSNAVGLILENLPALKEKKIVSLFFGGGTFELVLSKKLGFEVIGYDIFGMLTNFWQQLIEKPKQLALELSKLVPDSDNYTRNRHILLNYWEKIKPESLVYNTKNRLVLTEEEKANLINNLAESLREATEFVQDRVIGNFMKFDGDFGKRIMEAMKNPQ